MHAAVRWYIKNVCGLLVLAFAGSLVAGVGWCMEPTITRLTSDGRPFTSNGSGFSPDGKLILFMKESDEGRQLWIMNSDGTGAKPISRPGSSNRECAGPNRARRLCCSFDPSS